MEKFIGQDIENLQERAQFVKDNSERIEEIRYAKPLERTVIESLKEELAEAVISKAEAEFEKAEANAEYNASIKGFKTKIAKIADKLKTKSEPVVEECYKFIDEAEKKAGYYNRAGMLVYERQATDDELQAMLFPFGRAKAKGFSEVKDDGEKDSIIA